MAYYAEIVELYGSPKGEPIRYTCDNGTAIEKGTLLALQELRTVSGVSFAPCTQPFAGIAAVEKVAGDGSTTIGCYTKGIFDLYVASGSAGVEIGRYVVVSGLNGIDQHPAGAISGQCVVGKALEIGSANERIQVLVNLR